MTIVIPCAGKATGWGKEGSGWRPYGPMPLIMVAGKPNIEWAFCGLSGWSPTAHLVLVPGPSEAMEKYCRDDLPRLTKFQRVSAYLTSWKGGELETVLAARDFMAPNEPLLIAHSNVYVESNLPEVVAGIGDHVRAVALISAKTEPEADRGQSDYDPPTQGDQVELTADGQLAGFRWSTSFPRLEATGTYYFAKAAEFLELGSDIQRRGIRVDGELRLQSVIDAYLARQWRVETVTAKEAWPLRSSPDARRFEKWGGAPGATGPDHRWHRRCKYETPPSWLVEYPEEVDVNGNLVRPKRKEDQWRPM